LTQLQKRWAVKVYRYAINGNHLHLAIKAKTKTDFRGFLRVFSGKLALHVTGAKKGRKLSTRFWNLPAYTRIVEWQKAFRQLCRYIEQNAHEALGLIPYRPRRHRRRTPS
jgi:hypothetical protein